MTHEVEPAGLNYHSKSAHIKVGLVGVDLANFKVVADNGRKLGDVVDLIIESASNRVKYLEVKLDSHFIGGWTKKLKPLVSSTPIINRSESPIESDYRLVPVSIVSVDRIREMITIDGSWIDTVVESPEHKYQEVLTADYEASVIRAFETEHPPITVRHGVAEREQVSHASNKKYKPSFQQSPFFK